MALLPELLPAGPVELRRWRPAYADALTEAVVASLTELRPWMPWAQDAPTVPGMTQVLTDGEAGFDTDEEWQFVLGEPGSDLVLGAIGLHRRGPPDTVEIGYWIRTDATRRGLATAASRALTAAAFAHLPFVTTVEIRMDTGNVRSAAVPPRLGFSFDRQVDQAIDAPGQSGRWLVWKMERTDWHPVAD
ncbi:MAG TPA: GNAT family protein [Acidimicrobiales bacterium]